mmetsp:Transcript_6801/g.12621  ORF Transcript_6801/g.12621 Transcript_6801/m.12621 type:complete len:242 (+) Transcript_6801:237-962(+)
MSRVRRFLLVGEGDFSFALAWARFHQRLPTPISPSCLTATSLDSQFDVERKYGLGNVVLLRELGVTVKHEVDATQLPKSFHTSPLLFDEVRFNFPHALHRWRTQDNQILLRDFFAAAATVLRRTDTVVQVSGDQDKAPPQVIVTLSGGQGGTPADREHGRENTADSWLVTDAAAASQLVLVGATPFDYRRWNRRGYVARGHRRRIKGAPFRGALEHRFVPEEFMGEQPWRAPYFGKKVIWG